MNIVSLLPSATEIVCALGLEDQLVGVSHDCDWPPEVSDRPVLSSTRVDPDASSRDIHETVRDQTHGGRSLYHLEESRLEQLDPDLILTQELCEVCAPDFDDVRRAARLMDRRARVVSLEPTDLSEVLENIRLVGELTGRQDRAGRLVDSLEDRVRTVSEAAGSSRPRVVTLEWMDPFYLGGHWVPDMVERAGGEPLARPKAPSRRVEFEEVRAFEPEVLVLMPCGFDRERTRREYRNLERPAGWDQLPAVREGAVFATHGSHYFNRPGPRLVEGLEILASVFYPDLADSLAPPEEGYRRVAA